MVKVWGGAWNSDADPSIEKDFGIKSGHHYFSTEKGKDDFLKIINKKEYRNQGLVSDVKYGVMSHKRTIFVGTFEYEGKQFVVHNDFGYEYSSENAEFMYLDGNYSCDCNRSIHIRSEYGAAAIPELGCGEDVKLLEYHFEYKS